MDRLSSKGQMLSQIDAGSVAHSSFDRANHNFMSGKLGKLIVTRVDEVYPGDRIKGNISAVANFEPLVGPIMGQMVLKQESFFIPDSILWKNAHKFFTGKKNFSKPVPSVSPHRLFEVFVSAGLIIPVDTSLISRMNDALLLGDNVQGIIDDIVTVFLEPYHTAISFAERSGVVDLISPITDLYIKELGNKTIEEGSVSYDGHLAGLIDLYFNEQGADLKLQYLHEIYQTICNLLYLPYETFLGVSSHLDYMGWPVNDNFKDYFFYDSSANLTVVKSVRSVYDIFNIGIGTGITNNFIPSTDLFSDIPLNWLPLRAAYLCWYWNYRDQLLETSALDPEEDLFLSDVVSDNECILLSLLRVRCWYKDMYTTALTNTGDGNLVVPLGETPNYKVTFYSANNSLVDTSDFDSAFKAGATLARIDMNGVEYNIPMNYFSNNFINAGDLDRTVASNSGVSLDLFDRIRRLRSFLQKRFILGYEYDDMVWSSFRVKLSNQRMRIPELLSRGRDAVDINTLVNNTSTDQQIAGDKSAVAWAKGSQSDINYFSEEHGYFISFLTILPIQSYTGGLPRLYNRLEQFDYMWPEFANMGMDAIYYSELSAPRGQGSLYGLSDAAASAVFGYQGRYYDLKSRQDETHGRLRTDLNYLTFSREFNMENLPKLNYIFVHCWPRLDMFVTDDPSVDVIRTIDVYHGLDFERRLPVPSEIL